MSKSLKFDPDNPYDYSKKIRSRDKKVLKKMKKIIDGINNNNQESGKYVGFDAEELEGLEDGLE